MLWVGIQVPLYWYTSSTCAIAALCLAVTRTFTGVLAGVNAKVRDIGINSSALAPTGNWMSRLLLCYTG